MSAAAAASVPWPAAPIVAEASTRYLRGSGDFE
jgi:hypothetical protein